MKYIEYLKNKLNFEDYNSLLKEAVIYLGDAEPRKENKTKKHILINKWIERLYDKWNIKISKLPKSTNFLGRLDPAEGGFEIKVENPDLNNNLSRKVIAHEIEHILSFYYDKTHRPIRNIKVSDEEERFCESLSDEILFPKTLVNKNELPNINNFSENEFVKIEDLVKEFKITTWQLLRKIIERYYLGDKIAILWHFNKSLNCLEINKYISFYGIFIPHNKKNYQQDLFRQDTGYNNHLNIVFNNQFIFTDYDKIRIGNITGNLFNTTFPLDKNSIVQIIDLDDRLKEKAYYWRRSRFVKLVVPIVNNTSTQNSRAQYYQ